MITRQELLNVFSIGTSLVTSDKFLIHTANGRTLEITADVVRAYLKKNLISTFDVDEDGNVIIDGKPTGYKIQSQDLADIFARLEALEAGCGCECDGISFDADATDTPAPDDKLLIEDNQGTKHTLLLDSLRTYTFEHAPVWTPATASLTYADGFAELMEVGSPRATIASFVPDGTPATAVSDYATVTGGNANINDITIARDGYTFTATLTRTYAASSDKVVGEFGTPTNHSSLFPDVPIGVAPVNPDIDVATKVIRVISVEAKCAIQYVYRHYANTTTIDTIDSLPLSGESTIELAFPAETRDHKHTFDIPEAYTIEDFSVRSFLSDSYEPYDLDNFVVTPITHKNAAGTDVPYLRYTRNDGTNGATTFRLEYSVTG